MNPVYSLRSTTHSKNFSDVKEFLFPPCDSLLPSHQREDVTYQWYSGLDWISFDTMTILCWIRNMTQHNLWWLDMRSSPSLSRSSSSRSRFRRRSTPTTTTIFAKFFADDFFSTAIWRSTSLRYCTTSASATGSLSLYIFEIYFITFSSLIL